MGDSLKLTIDCQLLTSVRCGIDLRNFVGLCVKGEFRQSLDKGVMDQKRLAKSRSRLLETSQVILVWSHEKKYIERI